MVLDGIYDIAMPKTTINLESTKFVTNSSHTKKFRNHGVVKSSQPVVSKNKHNDII